MMITLSHFSNVVSMRIFIVGVVLILSRQRLLNAGLSSTSMSMATSSNHSGSSIRDPRVSLKPYGVLHFLMGNFSYGKMDSV